MPNPRKGEKRKAYVNRFMNSDEAKADFPKPSQREAVAHSKWRKRKTK